ncbi:uncharacterized protein TNCV_474151 [Trichonephila clavipes]|nr:uncharacterized protein TNCV_474151 [Trichonephila clavipes]
MACRSPDLSPIEHVWEGTAAVRDTGELTAQMQRLWQDLPQGVISDLIESMPRRISALYSCHSFLQAVGSTLVYCYRSTNVSFVNLSTSAAPWIACKGAFIQDPPSRQIIDGCVCNGLMNSEPEKLIGTKLSFQMNHVSICGTMMTAFELDAMPVNAAFQRIIE